MRSALFAALCVLFSACESSDTRQDVTVQWMDWPSEVPAGEAFRTRMVVWGVCALNPRFHDGASADQSAVTFAPYFVIDKNPVYCALTDVEALVDVGGVDTAGMAPALAADFGRTYEMRAAASVYSGGALDAALPARTFGDVTVRLQAAPTSRRNAAGYVWKEVDPSGCVRVRPVASFRPGSLMVLEDQADTAGLSYEFVRGYIYDSPAPVCGESRLFHLISRE